MLNSARRRLGRSHQRRLGRGHQRPGIERLQFRARLICRRSGFDASYESVGNAGSIDVTTTDKSPRTDSIKRCKGSPGISESEEVVWRDKEEPMSHA